MRCVRGTPLIAALAAGGLSVLIGCTQLQTHESLADLIKDRHGTNTPVPPEKPGREADTVPVQTDGHGASLSAIEATDVLMIEAGVKDPVAGTTGRLPGQPVLGPFVVQADGTVGLGSWGPVRVAGLSAADASAAVRKHLAAALIDGDFKPGVVENLVVKVDVAVHGGSH